MTHTLAELLELMKERLKNAELIAPTDMDKLIRVVELQNAALRNVICNEPISYKMYASQCERKATQALAEAREILESK